MKQKRLLALLLAAVMLVGLLAGCNKDESTDGKNNGNGKKPSSATNADKAAVTAKYAYKADYLELDSEFEYVNSSCFSNGVLYLGVTESGVPVTGTDEEGNEYTYESYRSSVYRVNIDTGACTRLENLKLGGVPEGWDGGDSNFGRMCAGQDGSIWISVNTYAYRQNLPEDFDPENDDAWRYQESYDRSELVHISPEGDMLGSILISENNYSDSGVWVEDAMEGMAAESAEPETQAEATDETPAEDAPAENAPDEAPAPRKLTADGDEIGYIDSFCISSDGTLYLSNYQNVYLFKADGTYLGKIECGDQGGNLSQINADTVGTTFWKQNEDPSNPGGGTYFRAINEDLTWGEEYKLPQGAWEVMPGDDVYDIYYSTNGKIFGYNFESQKSEKVVDWLESDVDSNNLGTYSILPDGRVVAFSTIWDNTAQRQHTEMVVLTRVDASTVTEKTVITLACLNLDWDLRTSIVNYNKTNEQYRIVVRDYSEYAADGDYDGAITKFNAELIGGNVPDIFMCDSLPIKKYAARGYLADLYELMETGSGIQRSELVPELLSAMETDGKLYQIPVTFGVMTAFALSKIVGDYDTWTIADLQDAMTKLPEDASVFGVGMTKDQILQGLLSRNISAYVDWQTGSCSFDSQGFIDLLKFAATFPDEFDWETYYQDEGANEYESPAATMQKGKQLLMPLSIYSLDDFIYQCYPVRNDISFVGFPSEDGSLRSSFGLQMPMAVSASSEHKDAAWSFISSVIRNRLEEQYYWGLPVLQTAFDKAVERVSTEQLIRDEEGNTVDWDEDGEPDKQQIGGYESYENGSYEWIPIYSLDETSVNMILDLIRSTTAVMDFDTEIMKIIMDDTGAFFAGDATAEDTARMIQSRVNLYVQEQR